MMQAAAWLLVFGLGAVLGAGGLWAGMTYRAHGAAAAMAAAGRELGATARPSPMPCTCPSRAMRWR